MFDSPHLHHKQKHRLCAVFLFVQWVRGESNWARVRKQSSGLFSRALTEAVEAEKRLSPPPPKENHPYGWFSFGFLRRRVELVTVVNEAPVGPQSCDLREPAGECSTLPTSTTKKRHHSVALFCTERGEENWVRK